MKLKPNQFILGDHLITERPILFQTEMVKAIMEDRKTQTRRTKGLEVPEGLVYDKIEFNPKHWPKKPLIFKNKIETIGSVDYYEITASFKSPYGRPGDLLWVKETWSKNNDGSIDFKTNFPFTHPMGGWKPSIHMPKAASRIWLMVEDVRVERLQDITEEGAKAEGVKYIQSDNFFERGYKNYHIQDLDDPNFHSALNSFESLWISINGSDSFESNPWVWVIKFRVLSKTGRPSHDAILASRLSVLESQERKEVSHV